MLYGTNAKRIIVPWMFIYSIIVCDGIACSPSDRTKPLSNSLSALSNSDAISDERTVTPLRITDVGFATMEIPSKSSVLRSWQLHLSRPKGKKIPLARDFETAIINQLDEFIGETLANKQIISFLEVYDGFLSANYLKELKGKGISPEIHPGIVYFARFRWKSLQIQVLGQLDQFLSIFIALPPGRESEHLEICKSLFPKIKFENMDDATGKVYSRGVINHHLRNKATEIRSGSRKRGETTFYGIRVNIDVAKMEQHKKQL